MGFFRLFLALLICVGHAKHYHLLPKEVLPQVIGLPFDPKIDIFFMIAGFFSRQTILHHMQAGVKGWVKQFYLTRCLRLWPAYWFCFVLTFVLVRIVQVPDYPPLLDVPLPEQSWWEFWPQNLVPFLPASLAITDVPYAWDTVIDRLLVFQAWTLAVLMVLFALAPILMVGRRIYPALLFSLCGIAYISMFCERFNGYVVNALPYYLAGAIAYDVYVWFSRRSPQLTRLSVALTILLMLCIEGMLAIYSTMIDAFDFLGAHTVSTLYAWVLLPFLYQLTRKNKIDRTVGDLAYPLYLSQFLTFWLLKDALKLPMATMQWAVIPSCLLVAAAIHYAIERPSQRLRQTWVKP